MLKYDMTLGMRHVRHERHGIEGRRRWVGEVWVGGYDGGVFDYLIWGRIGKKRL